MNPQQKHTQGMSVITLLVAVMLIMTVLNPAVATPLNLLDTGGVDVGLTELDPLTPAYLAIAEINQFFDQNGILIVNDLASELEIEDASGEAWFKTRLFPKGETGTLGVGYYAYLYRIDLTDLETTVEPGACVTQVSIPFGRVVTMDYDGDSVVEDYYVLSEGGALGSIAPSAVVLDTLSGDITVTFTAGVCAGKGSYYFGFTATETYQAAQAGLIISPEGAHSSADTRVPAPVGTSACTVIGSAAEIPSPAMINFDSLDDEVEILGAYQTTYGVTFGAGVKTDAIETPFTARSEPNVAYAPNVIGLISTLNFSLAQVVSHVGFYAGNPSSNPVDVLVTALKVQAGIPDTQVCEYQTTLSAGQLETFIGFYDPLQRINKVIINYPASTAAEIIDDLQFSPGNGSDRTEFTRARIPLGGGGPKIVINRSDNTRFAATFEMPDPALWMEEQEDGDMRRLRFSLPGTEINSNLGGYPDVPVIRRLIAIPEGAIPVLNNIAVLASDQFLADLYPSQSSAMDEDTIPPDGDPNDWLNPPYTIDWTAFKTNAWFPSQPVSVYDVGKMRDLNLALVIVAGGQYNPITRELVIFKEINFELLFEGGTGTFLPDYSNNPFEASIEKQYDAVLNDDTLGDYVGAPIEKNILGTELIIFTHPNFLTAANLLANWKISKGISTSIVQTGASDLDTPEEIKAYIKNKYDNSAVRPSYVLLLGDAEYIGSFDFNIGDPWDNTSSDLPYALMTERDKFPDLAYGRIPVDTSVQAIMVVNKIMEYERNPPTLSSFYDKVALASFFECCSRWVVSTKEAYDDRSMVESSETAHAVLIANGKTVTRIYTTDLDLDDYLPTYYLNGAPLPAEIGKGSGFAWDGNADDIIAAFNSGTGLIMHRDHGSPTGWEDPHFKIENLTALTNVNLTPVVYSINCSSGIWDNELPIETLLADTDVAWGERLLRMSGGAVSLIAALRNSPTWANSALARGLFDATWSSTLPDYGSSTEHRRLGDILNYAKLYLFTQVTEPQTAGEVTYNLFYYDNLIFHVIGDPTLELWKNAPQHRMITSVVYHWDTTSPSSGASIQELPTLTVEYPIEGAQITLLQNGLPVGRGVVVGSLAEITFVEDFNPGLPLEVSACTEDDICAVLEEPYQSIFIPIITR